MTSATSNPFSITIRSGQIESAPELEAVASSLDPGESTIGPSVSLMPFSDTARRANVHVHKFCYDATRSRAWWLGQSASSTGNYVYVGNYDGTVNTWTAYAAPQSVLVRGGSSRYQGHVYSGNCYDNLDGVGYWFPGIITPSDPTYGTKVAWLLRRTDFSTSAPRTGWTEPATSDIPTAYFSAYGATSSTLINSGANAIAWHPNLFGNSDGGLVVCAMKAILGWRKSTDTWSVLLNIGSDWITGAGAYACAEWCEGQDGVIVASAASNAYIVRSDGDVVAIADTPLPVGPYSGSANYAVLSPTDTGTYLLERNASDTLGDLAGARRCWKLSADLASWSRIGDHPFFTNQPAGGDNWATSSVTTTAGSMIWGIEFVYSTQFRNRFWKPSE